MRERYRNRERHDDKIFIDRYLIHVRLCTVYNQWHCSSRPTSISRATYLLLTGRTSQLRTVWILKYPSMVMHATDTALEASPHLRPEIRMAARPGSCVSCVGVGVGLRMRLGVVIRTSLRARSRLVYVDILEIVGVRLCGMRVCVSAGFRYSHFWCAGVSRRSSL